MTFLETSPAISDFDISAIESDLGVIFPNDFRAHYLSANGGYPEADIYKWSDGSLTTINTFFSIMYEGFTSLEKTYKNLILSEKYLPIGIIPFCTDDGGNFFCISCRERDYGYVYYCNNDNYNMLNNEDSLIKIEENFASFLENISRT